MGKIYLNNEVFGETVEANPQGTPTDSLSSIKINQNIYSISGGGGGGNYMEKGVDYVTAGQADNLEHLGNNVTMEGQGVAAYGNESHAEGKGTITGYLLTEQTGNGTEYYNEGTGSHSEGYYTSAYNEGSHTEGRYTFAAGYGAHAEGSYTTAGYAQEDEYNTYYYGEAPHSEGYLTYARNDYSHAEGYKTTAYGKGSHSEGAYTSAGDTDEYGTEFYGDYSHASGSYTKSSNNNSFAIGHFNGAMTTGGTAYNTSGTAFAVGNGTYSGGGESDAFKVEFDGTASAAGTFTAANSQDYAEFFEWADQNTEEEDRVGLFVTFDENETDKIRIASSADDYILGIVSGSPFVLGNGDCSVWNGMFLRDSFGRKRMEPAPKMKEADEGLVPEVDEHGEVIFQGTKPIINPDYDSTQPYIKRSERPEWDAIGMLGILAVYDDGTCIPGKYCTVAENGIATFAEEENKNCYRVIKRIDENIVKVVFR